MIVPKSTVRPPPEEPKLIRAQSDNPNYQALFAAPTSRVPMLTVQASPLGVDFNGKVFQQDGGLLMMDELFRNPGEFSQYSSRSDSEPHRRDGLRRSRYARHLADLEFQ